ncbi:hypothetical protein OESDEN_21974 [Oesophagostomum dentatum]|uniref:Uncharacterized protein n=1 Tax=Oesophagostomum dentatum TaxID=61180 RepID=A0A0B1S0D1_OESDE|nr:hypothetical protein OESDEN_21974 [Oesophagostomum dentatum]
MSAQCCRYCHRMDGGTSASSSDSSTTIPAYERAPITSGTSQNLLRPEPAFRPYAMDN